MQRTVLKTPVVGPLLRGVAKAFLKVNGWHIDGYPPDVPKAVVIAAPHTSNWDFVYALAVCFAANANIYWMGKHTLFRWPFSGFMKWLGGIPVDRARGYNAAKQAINAFKNAEDLLVVIPPEGTRSKAEGWKGGFYLIARGAKVPICLGYLDYRRKAGGFGPVIYPENVEEDMGKMREFYGQVTGRFPEKASDIILSG